MPPQAPSTSTASLSYLTLAWTHKSARSNLLGSAELKVFGDTPAADPQVSGLKIVRKQITP